MRRAASLWRITLGNRFIVVDMSRALFSNAASERYVMEDDNGVGWLREARAVAGRWLACA